MLSERERRALAEIEREVTAEDPRLAASLRASHGVSACSVSAASHGRWPYTAAVVTACALAASCLVLGLPGAMLGAAALAVLAIAVRWWHFSSPSAEPDDDPP